LHVAIGDFGKALELLKKQLAIGNFEPLKTLFVDLHTLSKLKFTTLPHTSPLSYQLRGANNMPSVVMTLNSLMVKYNKGIDLTTKGEFGLALDSFR
jgi:coatomer protein complex subunit alpha (xenin)